MAEKIIALSLVEQQLSSVNNVMDYTVDYLGLKVIDSDGHFIDIANAEYSNDINFTKTRFVKIPDDFNGKVYSYVGLKYKENDLTNKPVANTTLKYNESVKILDSANFRHYDALNNPATSAEPDSSEAKRDYFISSAPERISNTSLFTSVGKQYLARAPINGNARIYWHHLNTTGNRIIYAVMLENTSSVNQKITLNSRNYTEPGDWDGGELHLYTDVWDEIGIENDMTYNDLTFTIGAGEKRWICAYGMGYNSLNGGLGSNGVINLSIKNTDDTLYYGQNIICTTYAFNYDAEDSSIYKSSTANSIISDTSTHYETPTDDTGMRGSGFGAIMEVDLGDVNITYDSIKNIAFSGIALPDIEGDRILLTRYINTSDDSLYIGENYPGYIYNQNVFGLLRTYDSIYSINYDKTSGIKERILAKYVNYGVVYKIIFNNTSTSNVVGKVKMTPRVHGAMLADISNGLHINVWKYDSSGSQDTKLKTVLLQTNTNLIHPDASRLDGYDIIFDESVPQGQNEYYVAICGMSTLPYEISFENH